MDRQDVLLSAKAECLRLFSLLLPNLAKQSAGKLFEMAYKTTNFGEHRLFLDAYAALSRRESVLKLQLETSLADLLDRSVQTAYSPHRPSISQVGSTDSWLLVDSSTIEDEIRLQKVTSLFHARSGADIRDLNLRIAFLFKQDIVKERENPFRPYIFSRCLSATIGTAAIPADVAMAQLEQLAADLLDGVAGIYKSLNILFEKNGVAAKLPAPSKMPSIGQPAAMPDFSVRRSAGTEDGSSSRNDVRSVGNQSVKIGSAGKVPAAGPVDSRLPPIAPQAQDAPLRKVERLLRMVRGTDSPVPRLPGNASGAGCFPERESAHQNRPDGDAFGSAASVQAGSMDQQDSEEKFSGYSQSPAEFLNANMNLAGGWVSGKQVVGDTLQRFFAGSRPDGTVSSADSDEFALFSPGISFPVTESAIYHFLRTTQLTALEDVVREDGEIRNLILEGRSTLVSKASDVNEMMTIDVVGMIFEFILRDPQVPAEVRAQLGRLQFLLLKVAVLDPRLLTQKNHPARKLINRIGTVSLGLKSDDEFAARFTAEIQRIVEALLADELDSVVLISQLLEEFEKFLALNFQAANSNVELAVAAMEDAEKRSVYLARGLIKLKNIFSALKIDPFLQNFIESTWLRAIEKAEHVDEELAVRYRQLIPVLVWSILPKRNERERARLLSHLPQMLFDIKAGLSALKFAEKQAFLGWLVENHTRAIKAVGEGRGMASLSALRHQFHDFIDNPSSEENVDRNEVEFDRGYIRDAVEELEVRLDQIETVLEFGREPDSPDVTAAQAETSATDGCDFSDVENVMNRLRIGVSVEINVDGAPRIATLNWMNTGVTNMILCIEGNSFPTTISVGLFRRLLANSRARFIEEAPLFERAVTSLMETADKVDEIFE